MSGQTFSAEPGRLAARTNVNTETWFVRLDPQRRTRSDGSMTLTIGFPIVAVTGWVGEADEFAKLIAWLLTEHYAKAEPTAGQAQRNDASA